jgi:FkbM family methyltransferase
MNWDVKYIVSSIRAKVDIRIVRKSKLDSFRQYAKDTETLLSLPTATLNKLVSLIPRSKAQLRQDLFVLSELNFKNNGYFIEFGATNGIDLSNTFLLEKEFGWRGILAEPARCWHDALMANRANSAIDTRCVWRDSSSIISFNEANIAELSTISRYTAVDHHGDVRRNGRSYDVVTVSLIDLCRQHNAPREIDYLSIDTEGSEYDILKDFDFDEYRFNVITCEHAYKPVKKRRNIYELLIGKGYVRKYVGLSHFDDWYVRSK